MNIINHDDIDRLLFRVKYCGKQLTQSEWLDLVEHIQENTVESYLLDELKDEVKNWEDAESERIDRSEVLNDLDRATSELEELMKENEDAHKFRGSSELNLTNFYYATDKMLRRLDKIRNYLK